MSRYFSSRFSGLTPYVPGEQPQDQQYIKLNTNESPYPPSPAAVEWATAHTRSLNLYSDPECRELREALGQSLGVEPDQIMVTNGSDEVLNFAFMAFCDNENPAVFPDITYGFYPVFAQVNRVPYVEIPLKEDFTVDTDALCAAEGTIFLANPNAPTGILLGLDEISRMAASRPGRVVVVDEAYIDFGGESALKLLDRYDNLLITRTFSKLRALAGGRLGYGVGSPALMQDLNTLRYSTNPYNVNSMTLSMGLAILRDEETVLHNRDSIIRVREETEAELKKRGFLVLPSSTNFVFARTPAMDGASLYQALKAKGVLVRHFTPERIRDFNRITIGTREQMQAFFRVLDEILGGRS